MKLILALLAALSLTAQAEPDQELLRELYPTGVEVVHVTAPAIPTPFLTSVTFSGRCALLLNDSAPEPLGVSLLAALAHEAGHCQMLLAGVYKPEDGVTLLGEGLADVYALAWVSHSRPAELDAVYAFLVSARASNRRVNAAYNTLFIMRKAATSLPTELDPLEFTLKTLEVR